MLFDILDPLLGFQAGLAFGLYASHQFRLFFRALLRLGFQPAFGFFAGLLFRSLTLFQLLLKLPPILLRRLCLALDFFERAPVGLLLRPTDFFRGLPQGVFQLPAAPLRRLRALFGLFPRSFSGWLALAATRGAGRRRGLQRNRFRLIIGFLRGHRAGFQAGGSIRFGAGGRFFSHRFF